MTHPSTLFERLYQEASALEGELRRALALPLSDPLKLTQLSEGLERLTRVEAQLTERLSALQSAPEREAQQAVTHVTWPEALKALSAPPTPSAPLAPLAPLALSNALTQTLRSCEGDKPHKGHDPVEGWSECYLYFESLNEQLQALNALYQALQERPEHLERALEALRLRALSREAQRGEPTSPVSSR